MLTYGQKHQLDDFLWWELLAMSTSSGQKKKRKNTHPDTHVLQGWLFSKHCFKSCLLPQATSFFSVPADHQDSFQQWKESVRPVQSNHTGFPVSFPVLAHPLRPICQSVSQHGLVYRYSKLVSLCPRASSPHSSLYPVLKQPVNWAKLLYLIKEVYH